MNTNIKYWVSALLVISSGLLGTLIPGGPIETRNFSHIEPLILGTFNTFLTSLAIGSLLILYFVFKDMKWGFVASAICGASYFLIYVLDLGKIFPVSPDAMPQMLFTIEILGTIISLPLTFFGIRGFMNSDSNKATISKLYSTNFVYLVFFAVLISVGIITFATQSAMGS